MSSLPLVNIMNLLFKHMVFCLALLFKVMQACLDDLLNIEESKGGNSPTKTSPVILIISVFYYYGHDCLIDLVHLLQL